VAVLDLSTTGFGIVAPPEVMLAPGTVLDGFELLIGGHPVWTGEAVVVHATSDRLGGRFTSRVLDLQHLRLGATLEDRLEHHQQQRDALPAEWRAAVADILHMLEQVRVELERIDLAESYDPLGVREEEAHLFGALRRRWVSTFHDALSELHFKSKGLDPRTRELARGYASSMLMPVLRACPCQRRAFEKPLGYAGDYRMMELLFARDSSGEGLFGRFMHSVTQDFTLVRAVVGREVVMRRAVAEALVSGGEGAVRVLALAAGPAIELRRLLEDAPPLDRPVQLILLDHDPDAHETAHRHLTRLLVERHRGMLPVSVECLHFSVRQIIRPQSSEEREIVANTLADLDLAYAAGLYDYLSELVAVRLTQTLYSRLRPGGRLLLGNLVEAPDTCWMMDYVWDWPLVYRTDEAMLRLAQGLTPAPSSVRIVRDATEHCLFLDVRRPSTST
jgi:hypothetical protein